MVFESLGEFATYLEKKGDLTRIDEPISRHLEMTELAKRLIEKNGTALLFNHVLDESGNRFNYPAFANIFATKERVALGLGGRTPEQLKELGETLAFLAQPKPPASLKEAFKLLPLAKDIFATRPSYVKNPACQHTVLQGAEIDLTQLPIQHCWPKDAAPLVTWGLVVTQPHGKEGIESCNLGIYRLQLLDKDKLILRWLPHRGGARHFAKWCAERGDEPMPVAIVIGADPATMLAAVAPVPDHLPEYAFAGLVRGKAVKLTQGKTINLPIPAEAEIVLEGHIKLGDTAPEGPFGDHTGYYNNVEEFPILRLSAITMREKPIYATTFTGRPPDEPSVIGTSMNDMFTPIIKRQFPEIVDFWLPPEACSYRIAVVAINKTYAGQARRIMMGIWSFLPQFLYTKMIIVVDEDINPRDWKDVMWAVSTRSDPVRDILTIPDTPMDYLDFSSPVSGLAGKLGIDATTKIGAETKREFGEVLQMSQEVQKKIDNLLQKLGL